MIEFTKEACEITSMLKCAHSMKKDEIYMVKDTLILNTAGAYSANGATIIAEKGIEISASNVSLINCSIISNYGDIRICRGVENTLIAFNTITGNIKSDGAKNAVILLNTATAMVAEDNTNLYVIKNEFSEGAKLKRNRYLICDGNSADISLVDNTEINGDNVHDLSVRMEYGANDDLLPHVNKELFVGMERQRSVTAYPSAEGKSLADYIVSSAKENDVVIVPPGAYTVDASFTLGEEQSNTEIYAYGVYAEASYLGQIMHINGASNLMIQGITFGYAPAASGQVEVVEILGDNKIIAVNTAGFDKGFGKSDTTKYNIGQTYIYRHDEPGIWGGMANAYYIDDNCDGTYTITFADPFGTYERLKVGDIIACRMAGSSSQTVLSHNAVNVKYKDITLFGYGAATAFRTKDGCDSISLERYCLTNRAPYIIDKETYDRYKAWEEKYGVDLEVFIDGKGRYRGGAPRIGGVGGMEVENAKAGVCLISCLIENIVDDGSNQRGTSGRVAGIRQNDDGTYTVYYKGSLSSVYHQSVFSRTAHTTGKADFAPLCTASVKKGDKVFAYASNGAVLFDNATALEDAYELTGSCEHLAHADADGDGKCDVCGVFLSQENTKEPSVNNAYHPEDGRLTFNVANTLPEGPRMLDYTTYIYAVKISADGGVDMSALDGYDLLSNDYNSKTQIFFDNVGKNCANFRFDNIKVQNNVARGLLVKTRGVEVKHCTFKHQALQGMIIGRETNWGESSIPRNILIEDCIFDGTSNSYKNVGKSAAYAQINIQGLGEVNNNITLHDNFACANITIKHNKFLNTSNGHIIHASGTKGLTVTDNIFEEHDGDGVAVYLNGCLDVDISGNKYSDRLQKAIGENRFDKAFKLYKYKNLTIEGRVLPDSEENPSA